MQKKLFMGLYLLGFPFFSMPAFAAQGSLSGSYVTTGNLSTINKPLTSLNQRIGLTYVPSFISGSFDYRVEDYTETSFHTPDKSIINEHKFETQLNYSQPLNDQFAVTAGLLYHTNRTFQDTYFWVITGFTYNQTIFTNTSLTAALLAEKRTKGGQVFFDASGTIEQHLTPKFSVFGSLHRYQNFGELDTEPSQKTEYELGANYKPTQRYYIGVSYLHHSQDNDPDDRFALAKLKLGVNF